MKSKKRADAKAEKVQRKRAAMDKKGGKGHSKYAEKKQARRGGIYSDTSPLRFGANATEEEKAEVKPIRPKIRNNEFTEDLSGI